MAISRWSTERNKKDDNLKWFFPSAICECDHCEWTFRRIMDHLGLFTALDDWSDPVAHKEFRQEVADYHISRGLWESNEEEDYNDLVTSFMSVRPDGIAFNAEDKECVFLEFTCPMDTLTSYADEPSDWTEKKDITKDLRYENHRIFLEEYSDRKMGRLRWSCTQANFTVGVRCLIKTDDFDTRLAGLGVHERKVRQIIAMRTVKKTLELSDAMLSIFHLSIRTNPEWAKHAVSDKLVNTSTERYNLFKRFTGLTSSFGI